MISKSKQAELAAIGDSNQPVDWFFLYKIAGKSTVTGGSKAAGTEYIYFDAGKQKGEKLTLSPNQISDPAKGAVSNTLNQIYANLTNPDMGWFFYNDEDPITGKTNGSRGHTKGILCFDTVTNSGFWMIHSAPKFPPEKKYSYPETATGNAQTFLCITLKDADTAKAIAAQMFVAHQPNVYLSSDIPTALKNAPDDPRVQLINNQITPKPPSYGNFIAFQSKSGMQFRSVAKNKEWNTPEGNDFYNDLVGPMLKEDLEVETWEHGKEPDAMDGDKVHRIMAMKEVDLAPLNFTPSYAWSEENDHAKLVVSEQAETPHFVCVGDINFTVTMEERSGGTVAFQNETLWNSILEILKSTNSRPAKVAKKT